MEDPSAPPQGPEAQEQKFYQVTRQALAKIQPEEATRRSLLATITELASGGASIDATETETVVETLDQLLGEIQDSWARDRYLTTLSRLCRDHVILPKSYIVSGVEVQDEGWKNGGVSDIHTGRFRRGDVCIKVFRQHKEEQQAKIKSAFYYHIVRWRYLSHDNVLPFLGVSKAHPPLGLISPRMPYNIKDYMMKNLNANRLQLLTNAACGLEYLHSLDVAHGGISPENILITRAGVACIADFEIVGIITDPATSTCCNTTTCRRGVARYMAPEQVDPDVSDSNNGNPMKATDIYSFAMTAYEVLTDIQPYPGIKVVGQLTERITRGPRPSRPEEGAAVIWLSDELWTMMVSCWVVRPKSRPLIETVRQAFNNSVLIVNGSDRRHNTPQQPTLSHPPQSEAGPPAKGGFMARIRDLRSYFSPRDRDEKPPARGGSSPVRSFWRKNKGSRRKEESSKRKKGYKNRKEDSADQGGGFMGKGEGSQKGEGGPQPREKAHEGLRRRGEGSRRSVEALQRDEGSQGQEAPQRKDEGFPGRGRIPTQKEGFSAWGRWFSTPREWFAT